MKDKILAYGWTDLGEQRMTSMKSFVKGTHRLNWYTTTGTMTVQLLAERYDQGDIHKEVTEDTLDEILSTY